MLSNFAILILTHFVSDWFLQPGKWGETKQKIFKSRLLHCIQYTLVFIPALYFLKINMYWLIWIFITHLLIDDYKFVNWWNKNIKRITRPVPDWFMVVQDQILHVLVLVPVVLL